MCWYCYNTDPSMRPHRYRDACPLFQHHVAMGTVHLNAEGRMVLGCIGEGGPEVLLWASQGSQGDQIMKKVVGTKYDPNLANRPAETRPRQEVGRSGASVGFITVDRFKEDSDKEEYKFPEGYGQVSVVSIADVDTVQVEKDKRKEQEGWKNPMKILKRKQEKEKTYAIGKSARAGTWEPVKVTDMTDKMEVEIEEVVKKKGIGTAEQKEVRLVRGTAKKEKYMDRWKEECCVDEVFDEIMGQRVEIRMKDLLVCSKPFWDLMFKETVRNDKNKEAKKAQAVLIGSLTSSK